MQIKNYIFFILLCFSATVSSQNNTFYRKYNLGGMQGALQLAVTNDGGFIATGQHEGIGSHGDCDIYVYKLDYDGPFHEIGDAGNWWSSTEYGPYSAWYRFLYYYGSVSRKNDGTKKEGISVRCLRD